MTHTTDLKTTLPEMSDEASARTIQLLQERLVSLIDLHLTLKHIHWNVVGMNFIAIHEMLDPQVDAARLQTDAVAERIATMGGQPQGTPGAVVEQRPWVRTRPPQGRRRGHRAPANERRRLRSSGASRVK